MIELLTVIVIIGVLSTLVFTGTKGLIMSAQKSKAASDMSNIWKSYMVYENDNGSIDETLDGEKMVDTDGDTPSAGSGTNHEWFAVLASSIKDFNNPEKFILSSDKYAKKKNKGKEIEFVLDPDEEDDPKIDQVFKEAQLSYNVVAGIDLDEMSNVPEGKIPFIYTPGLNDEGKWTKNGVFGTSGGIICFMDGQSKRLKNLKEAKLKKWDDPKEDADNLKDSVFGIAFGHGGPDEFSGERGE